MADSRPEEYDLGHQGCLDRTSSQDHLGVGVDQAPHPSGRSGGRAGQEHRHEGEGEHRLPPSTEPHTAIFGLGRLGPAGTRPAAGWSRASWVAAVKKAIISLLPPPAAGSRTCFVEGMAHHHAHATGHAAHLRRSTTSDDDDDHLQEVGDSHRPHAQQGVHQDGGRADPHAGQLADLAARDHALKTSPEREICAPTQPR